MIWMNDLNIDNYSLFLVPLRALLDKNILLVKTSGNALFFFNFLTIFDEFSSLNLVIYLLLLFLFYFSINIAFSKDLVSACVYLLALFVLGGLLLCFYNLIYFGVLYLLVYAGAISILFVFIIFLLNLDLDYTGISFYNIIFMFFFTFFLTTLYGDFLYLNTIDNNFIYWREIGWLNYYKQFTHNYINYGFGVHEVALFLYLNNIHFIILIGLLLALCTVGPILIISGPFLGKLVFKSRILNFNFDIIRYHPVFIRFMNHPIIQFIRFFITLVFFLFRIFVGFLVYVFLLYHFMCIIGPITVTHYYPFFRLIPIFLLVIVFYFILLYLSSFFGSLRFVSLITKEQATPYECGFAPYESSRTKFEVHFFLVAILFLVFDIEVTYIYPYVLIQHLIPFDSVIVLIYFLIILAFGLLYEWYSGVLFWSEEHSDDFRVLI